MVSVLIPTFIISLTFITYLCTASHYTSCDLSHAWGHRGYVGIMYMGCGMDGGYLFFSVL